MKADQVMPAVIPLDYAPPQRRWFRLLLIRWAIVGLITAGAGGVAFWLTPPRFESRAFLEVGPKLWVSPIGRVRNVYAFVDRESVRRVLESSCDVARTQFFRDALLQELTNDGLNARTAAQALRTLEVRSFEDTRLICVSVASDNPATSRQVANTAMAMLVRTNGKVVVDPIGMAATPAGPTRTVVPALCTSAVMLCGVLYYVQSSRRAEPKVNEMIV